ncbi:leucine-rich repeat domain-containing protein [Tessaracoccus massiliensis]|uniref:leucine-rich repeat domain-containing protein n=1 Tax=Tessaracoccus massiliensis TaxID=1522311 RepID=UPI0006933E97|nr:leucine-rich repeat domain-containing protein [Tessaracoccus massiliensis]
MNSPHPIRRAVSTALALAVTASVPWASQAQADFSFTDAEVRECTYDNNVFVIVDPGEGDLLGGCATEFETGSEALVSAGFTIDDPAFIKVINGVRADYVADGKWWTYFHRQWSDDAGWGDWEFSQLGASSYQPAAGSVEGWAVSPATTWNGNPPRWEGYKPGEVADPAPLAPTVVTQPVDVATEVGFGATFTVEVAGRPAPAIAWERSADGATWAPIDGASGGSLALESVTLADHGHQFRAVVANPAGTVHSSAARLTVTDPTLVDVPDPKFRLCLNDKLGQAADSAISQDQLNRLTGELNCTATKYRTITDITGAEHLTGLSGLSIGGQKVTDLTPVAGLTNLTSLTAYGNGITDLRPVAGLTGLTELSMATNQISDLAPIAALTNLTELMLNGNLVSDPSVISGLPNVTEVGLSRNQLTSVTGLKSDSIRDLTIDDNKITELDVSGLTNLKRLVAHKNGFSSLSSLSGLTKLETFAAQGNKISDLSPLKGATSLSSLLVSNNLIEDVTPLAGFATLKSLDLGTNAIADLSPLKHVKVTDYSAVRARWQKLTMTAEAGAPAAAPAVTYLDGTPVELKTPEGVTVGDDGSLVFAEPGDYTLTWSKNAAGGWFAGSILATVAEAQEPTPEPVPTVTVTVTATPEPAPTVTVTSTPEPAPTVTATTVVTEIATPEPAPTVTATATATVTATATATSVVTQTATPEPAPTVTATSVVTETAAPSAPPAATGERTAPYTLPGLHEVNGRRWNTACEPYSATERCRTDIWATTVVEVDGEYEVRQGWAFNNLTYLPAKRATWAGNPLAETGAWTAEDGRQWRTECDTVATGSGACRSYVRATLVSAQPADGGGYRFARSNEWVFNNIVAFTPAS